MTTRYFWAKLGFLSENWVKNKEIEVNIKVEGKNHSFQRRQHIKDEKNHLIQ